MLAQLKNATLLRIATLIILGFVALAAGPAAQADGPEDKTPHQDKLHTAVSSDGSPTIYLARARAAQVEDGKPADMDRLALTQSESGLEPAPKGNPQGESGIASLDPDRRERVGPPTSFPYPAIAHLEVTFRGISSTCTGFFIGPHTVATTGGCVYSHYFGGWARSVRVIAGRDDLSSYGSQYAIRFHSVRGWTEDGDTRYDYGAVILPNDDLGNRVGWFGFISLRDNQLNGLGVHWAGYPRDKPYGTMWRHSGDIAWLKPRQVFGMDPLNGGPSGAPWWYLQERGPYVVAIRSYYAEHYCEVTEEYERCSSAESAGSTRITQAVVDNLRAWKQ